MKGYLDNNVVSAIVRDDNPSESKAISLLLEAYESGRIELVTSEITLDEIKQYLGQQRAAVERVFRLLKKIPIARWDELVGMRHVTSARTMINSPVIRNDPLFDALLSLGLEVVDAKHVFVATKQSCGYFLTCDKGILKRASDIQSVCGIHAEKPSQFLKARGW